MVLKRRCPWLIPRIRRASIFWDRVVDSRIEKREKKNEEEPIHIPSYCWKVAVSIMELEIEVSLQNPDHGVKDGLNMMDGTTRQRGCRYGFQPKNKWRDDNAKAGASIVDVGGTKTMSL